MEQREKLIELLKNASWRIRMIPSSVIEEVADHLLTNGVVVLPCRCDDCERYTYSWKSDGGQVYGLCDIHGTADLKSTDFCSYAKRKGGDE